MKKPRLLEPQEQERSCRQQHRRGSRNRAEQSWILPRRWHQRQSAEERRERSGRSSPRDDGTGAGAIAFTGRRTFERDEDGFTWIYTSSSETAEVEKSRLGSRQTELYCVQPPRARRFRGMRERCLGG